MEVEAHPLFQGCNRAVLAPVLERLRPVRVPAGKVLVTQRRGPARLFLVLEGALVAYGHTAEGRRVIFELARPGELDGILAASGRRGHYTAAQLESVVLPLTRAELQRLIAADTRVGLNLISLLMGRIVTREQQIEVLAHSGTSARIARQLLALAAHLGVAQPDGTVLLPRLTHQTLADMVGLRRETVTRGLEQLSQTGGIVPRGRRLTVRTQVLEETVEAET